MATLTLTAAATAAAQFLHVLDSGESLSAQQLADALAASNSLLDNWSSEEHMVPSLLLQTFALTGNQQSYTIGTGLNFNVARPVAIPAAAMIVTAYGSTQASEIKMLNAAEWASLPDRNSSSILVRSGFYDRALANAKVYFSPVPLGGSVELTMWSALTQFADTTTAITIPVGYDRLIKLGLAIELAPQYDMAPSETLVAMFADAVARVRSLNAQLLGNAAAAPQAAQ